MKLDIETWKEFKLIDLFKIKGTKTTKLDTLEIYGKGYYPYVTTQSTNNGVGGFYNFYTEDGNVFTVDSAVLGYCSYQETNFSASDHVEILEPLFPCNRYIGAFISTVLNKSSYKFSYGRKASQKALKKEYIKLPVTAVGELDFEFMENYIKSLYHKPITTQIKSVVNDVCVSSWKEYSLDSLFTFVKGKRLTKEDMIAGNVNYLGAISENNGVREHIQADPKYICNPNCITVNYNGSVGEAFYQHEPFWASDDVNILYAKGWNMNKFNALFIVTIIKTNKYRFSYGRKWTLGKMKESYIKLPCNHDGSPDFEFMENYIKSLPYSDKI